MTSAEIYYEENSRISGVRFFWSGNTVEDAEDDLDTLIGAESSNKEAVTFSETDVFFGFYGSADEIEIKSLGFLVHSPICSKDIADDSETKDTKETMESDTSSGSINDLENWEILVVIFGVGLGVVLLVGIAFAIYFQYKKRKIRMAEMTTVTPH